MNFVLGKCWQTFCLLKKQKMAEIHEEHKKKTALFKHFCPHFAQPPFWIFPAIQDTFACQRLSVPL